MIFVVTLLGGVVSSAKEIPEPRSKYNDPLPVNDSERGKYLKVVEECGKERQKHCIPERTGGKTMCGMAVGDMVACVIKKIGRNSSPCNCGAAESEAKCNDPAKKCCGNGNDYINCDNGALAKCGYARGYGNGHGDPKVCDMPGAVRSYKHTPTNRGKIYGHVEFVCGEKKYCSIYHEPLDHSWPRNQKPDACWIPDQKLIQFLNEVDSSKK
jgi:hypothetical protein